MGRGPFVCLKALGGRGLCGRGRAFMFSFWWVVVGEVTGAGLKNVTILLCILKPQLFTSTAI